MERCRGRKGKQREERERTEIGKKRKRRETKEDEERNILISLILLAWNGIIFVVRLK